MRQNSKEITQSQLNGISLIMYKSRDLIQEFYSNRKILLELAKRDFKIMYGGNYLGLAWAIIEPVAMMFIMLLVFTYLRSRAGGEYPFVAYLLTGVMAYNFFNSGLSQATKSMKLFSYLIRQGNMKMAILPTVNILSSLITHIIILIIGAGIFATVKVYPSWYLLQLIYCFFASSVLLLGLTWITSSLVVFVWDINFIINIIMRGAFFLTPIFWNIEMFPHRFAAILKLNPLYHIVETYRMCFLYHKPFWSDTYSFVSFWIITIVILLLGAFVYKRLRPHFDDVV